MTLFKWRLCMTVALVGTLQVSHDECDAAGICTNQRLFFGCSPPPVFRCPTSRYRFQRRSDYCQNWPREFTPHARIPIQAQPVHGVLRATFRWRRNVAFPDPKIVPIPAELGGGAVDLQEWRIDPVSRGVANIVVRLRPTGTAHNLPAQLNPDKTPAAQMQIVGNQFVPRHLIARPGQSIEFTNCQAGISAVVRLDTTVNETLLFLLAPGQTRSLSLPKGEKLPARVTNSISIWMKGFLFITADPAAISDEQGRIEINHLPPGQWEIEVWHGQEKLKDLVGHTQHAVVQRNRTYLTIRPGTNDLGIIQVGGAGE